MFSMAVKIRGRNAHLIGKGWNGRASMRQYKKLAIVTEDEDSKRLIRDFSNYTKMQVVILFAGISLFLLIGFLNSRMNG